VNGKCGPKKDIGWIGGGGRRPTEAKISGQDKRSKQGPHIPCEGHV